MIYMISFVTVIEIDLDIHSSLSLGVRSGRRGHISPLSSCISDRILLQASPSKVTGDNTGLAGYKGSIWGFSLFVSLSLSLINSSFCAREAQHIQPNLYTHTHACWLAGGVVSALSFYPALSLYLISPTAFCFLLAGRHFYSTPSDTLFDIQISAIYLLPGNCPDLFLGLFALRSMRLRLLGTSTFLYGIYAAWWR